MAYVGQVTGANQWIAPDLQTYPASYIIHEDNSTYYAQGFGGLPNQSGTDAAIVIQSAINNLPSGGGKIFLTPGVYNLNSQTAEDPHDYALKIGSASCIDNIHIEGAGIG